MDAQGVVKVSDLGSVSIINIDDLFSRVKVDSFPCLNTSHPNTLDYQMVLRRAFLRYGLPERVSLDHDSVFYDNASASPYPSTLHLWLITLGVDVRFIEQKPPTEHSVIERAHQTINQQAVAGQTFADGSALQQSLSDRLDFLNRRFPSRSLGGQPPLVAYPEAQHSGRFYRLESFSCFILTTFQSINLPTNHYLTPTSLHTTRASSSFSSVAASRAVGATSNPYK